jgi:hypothetical protein
MMLDDCRSRAIFGDRLWGDRLMRFVYMDEAGTSANEPMTVVVGLIVDADAQLMDTEAAIREVNDGVPTAFRDGFVFHADAIWNDPKYRAEWSMADRLAVLKRMMALPRRLKVPIAFSLVRRDGSRVPPGKPGQMSAAQFEHAMAFGFCVARADKYIRERAEPKEIGSIVAEDVPEMRRFLKAAVQVWRDNPTTLPPGAVQLTLEEQKLGYVKQESEFRVSRIRKSVLFVEKNEDPLTQLADAIAFGLRRYHCELDLGADLATAIFGDQQPPPPLADFTTPTSSGVYGWSNRPPASVLFFV